MVIYEIEEVPEEKVNMLGHTYILVDWRGFPSSSNFWIHKQELREVAVTTPVEKVEDEEPSNFIGSSHVLSNVS